MLRNPRNLWLAVLAIIAGCSFSSRAPSDWVAWQARRNESIGGTNGWTTLVGLHWLKEGENSAGTNPTNQVVMQSASVPAFLGVFTRNGASVVFTAAESAEVRVGGEKVGRIELNTDASSKPTKLEIGAASIVAIQRADRVGLRVRDSDSETRRKFRGLRWFPYDPTWRLDGRFVPFPAERRLRVPDVTGATQEFTSPGAIVFSKLGSEYRLDVIEEEGNPEFFVLFGDKTAGDSTYAAGRFLDVAKPDSTGRVVIDFNRAFTPPCGFTDFATCPRPPQQNWLSLAIRAGELKPRETHR
jgi:uncharacterized protein (DUF1684 family)